MTVLAKKLLIQVHLWLGLAVGAVLLVIAGSGFVLLLRPTVEPALHPERTHAPSSGPLLPLDELVRRALLRHPEAKVDLVQFREREDPVMVRLKTGDDLWFDAVTGGLVSSGRRYGGFFGLAERVHRFLLLVPRQGEPLTGAIAVTALLLCVTGITLWLPKTLPAFRRSLAYRGTQRGKGRMLALHKFVGGYVALIIAASATSGIPDAFETVKGLLYPLTFSHEDVDLQQKDAHTAQLLSLESLWRKAAFLAPDAAQTTLRLRPGGQIEALFVARDAPHPYAQTRVRLDGVSGGMVRHIPYRDASRGFRLGMWLLAFHLGLIGGPLVQLLLATGALGLGALVITGTISFVKRRTRRSAAVSGAQPRLSISAALPE